MLFFIICFGVGLLFLILTAALGGVLDVFDIDIGGLHHDIGAGGHMSPLSPTFLSFFLTVFGGVGGVCMELWDVPFRWSLILALVISLGAATLVYIGLAKVFAKTQGGVEVNVAEMGGREAEVITSIPEKGVGEIALITAGGRLNGPARSLSGEAIRVNTTVKIVKVVGSTYIVQPAVESAGSGRAGEPAPAAEPEKKEAPAEER